MLGLRGAVFTLAEGLDEEVNHRPDGHRCSAYRDCASHYGLTKSIRDAQGGVGALASGNHARLCARQLGIRDRNIRVIVDRGKGERRKVPGRWWVCFSAAVELDLDEFLQPLIAKRAAFKRTGVVRGRDGLRMIARTTGDKHSQAAGQNYPAQHNHSTPRPGYRSLISLQECPEGRDRA